jgi:hypothetical protein
MYEIAIYNHHFSFSSIFGCLYFKWRARCYSVSYFLPQFSWGQLKPLFSARSAIFFVLYSLLWSKSNADPCLMFTCRPNASESLKYSFYFAWLRTWVSLLWVLISPASNFFLKIYSPRFTFYSMTSGACPSASSFYLNYILLIKISRFLSCSIISWLAFLGGATFAFCMISSILFWLTIPVEIGLDFEAFYDWRWCLFECGQMSLSLLQSVDLSRCTFYYKFISHEIVINKWWIEINSWLLNIQIVF